MHFITPEISRWTSALFPSAASVNWPNTNWQIHHRLPSLDGLRPPPSVCTSVSLLKTTPELSDMRSAVCTDRPMASVAQIRFCESESTKVGEGRIPTCRWKAAGFQSHG